MPYSDFSYCITGEARLAGRLTHFMKMNVSKTMKSRRYMNMCLCPAMGHDKGVLTHQIRTCKAHMHALIERSSIGKRIQLDAW